MAGRLDRENKPKEKEIIYDDATTSAVGSIVAHFLAEHKAKGGILIDHSRGLVVYPDDTSAKLENTDLK